MGHGGQDKPAGKSGITSDEKKDGILSCGPFPHPVAWSKCLISEVLPDLYFVCVGIPF